MYMYMYVYVYVRTASGEKGLTPKETKTEIGSGVGFTSRCRRHTVETGRETQDVKRSTPTQQPTIPWSSFLK